MLLIVGLRPIRLWIFSLTSAHLNQYMAAQNSHRHHSTDFLFFKVPPIRRLSSAIWLSLYLPSIYLMFTLPLHNECDKGLPSVIEAAMLRMSKCSRFEILTHVTVRVTLLCVCRSLDWWIGASGLSSYYLCLQSSVF
jgi:hypothetical protein